jgi:hypothetical protein
MEIVGHSMTTAQTNTAMVTILITQVNMRVEAGVLSPASVPP